ncbi:type I restriction enzyme endonuclease domain-containing protein [Limibacillus halophilus]|uniref:type I restriction enzyme endonuclease domain-containing protein n=1 Tax=Limibacillus halophilus TaxID=1579333 RepID=UPI00345FAA53
MNSLKTNASVDWQYCDPAHALMHVLMKRILRKIGYPPGLQNAAVQTVLQQADGPFIDPTEKENARQPMPRPARKPSRPRR